VTATVRVGQDAEQRTSRVSCLPRLPRFGDVPRTAVLRAFARDLPDPERRTAPGRLPHRTARPSPDIHLPAIEAHRAGDARAEGALESAGAKRYGIAVGPSGSTVADRGRG
jgi:hypothetical protein